MKGSRAIACIAGIALAGGAHAKKAPPPRTVVWTADRCERSDTMQAAGLETLALSLIVGPLIKEGLTSIGDALQRAGAPRDLHGHASLHTNLYRVTFPPTPLSPPLAKDEPDRSSAEPVVAFRRSCVIVAAGPAKAAVGAAEARRAAAVLDAAGAAPLRGRGESAGLDPAVLDPLGIGSARVAVLVAELEPSPDRTAFRLVPKLVLAGASMRNGRTQPRGLTFTTTISAPGALADGTAVALRTVSLPQVTTPRTMVGEEARALASSWIPMPPVSDLVIAHTAAAARRRADYAAVRTAASTASGGRQAKLHSDMARLGTLIDSDTAFLAQVAPYTWRGDVHETEPGDKFLVSFGKLLSGSADKGSAAAAEALDGNKRAATAEADTQKLEALRMAAIGAEAEAAAARAAGNTGAARVAEIKLAAACRQIAAAGYAETSCAAAP